MMLKLTTDFRYNFPTQYKQISFRPGVSIGLALLPVIRIMENSDLNNPEFKTLKSSRYLMAGTFFEIAFHGEKNVKFLNVGLSWALMGGNSENHITAGPLLILQAGFGAR